MSETGAGLALFGKKKRSTPDDQTLSLYYASDVHGSDQCWRKFLGAGRFYGVDALIMGGDLTGKAIVPIESNGNGSFKATFLGEVRSGKSERQLEELLDAIRYNGMYPWIATADEIAEHSADLDAQSDLFDSVIVDELRRWITLADERMAQYGIEVYVMPGNDDPWSCDAVIEDASHVVACDDRVVRVGRARDDLLRVREPHPMGQPARA